MDGGAIIYKNWTHEFSPSRTAHESTSKKPLFLSSQYSWKGTIILKHFAISFFGVMMLEIGNNSSIYKFKSMGDNF